jgi:hypothetical protein
LIAHLLPRTLEHLVYNCSLKQGASVALGLLPPNLKSWIGLNQPTLALNDSMTLPQSLKLISFYRFNKSVWSGVVYPNPALRICNVVLDATDITNPDEKFNFMISNVVSLNQHHHESIPILPNCVRFDISSMQFVDYVESLSSQMSKLSVLSLFQLKLSMFTQTMTTNRANDSTDITSSSPNRFFSSLPKTIQTLNLYLSYIKDDVDPEFCELCDVDLAEMLPNMVHFSIFAYERNDAIAPRGHDEGTARCAASLTCTPKNFPPRLKLFVINIPNSSSKIALLLSLLPPCTETCSIFGLIEGDCSLENLVHARLGSASSNGILLTLMLSAGHYLEHHKDVSIEKLASIIRSGNDHLNLLQISMLDERGHNVQTSCGKHITIPYYKRVERE